ncbi:hypothetical protein PoB_004943900 [Plakobranchus ocellatus]|uniref:Uncharacterized protein n=1 Tax=Plakobranchus ocellatus TaxID=259542 RepID=A0AAV4BWZ0_9GAST|nr:hypothetical protein PoB_004943900 [Plakobranchus ocellatus]
MRLRSDFIQASGDQNNFPAHFAVGRAHLAWPARLHACVFTPVPNMPLVPEGVLCACERQNLRDLAPPGARLTVKARCQGSMLGLNSRAWWQGSLVRFPDGFLLFSPK